MGWFRRKKATNEHGDAFASRIAGRILHVQRRLADQLNARAKKVDPKALKVWLFATGLLFGGYCLWLVVNGLFDLM